MSTAHAAITHQVPRWSILWSIVLVIFGLLAIALPLATSFGVVLIIGWLLILSSVIQLLHAFQSNGIGTFLLGFLIWMQWPWSSAWAIGTLVGISMLMTGVTRLMITLTARRLGEEDAG